jgi:hypothetical protein
MTDSEITALAREYAEEENPIESYSDTMFERALDLSISRGEALRVLTWLTRRFCLVEKEKLKAIRFRKVYSAEDMRSKFTEECLIDALFPEIAKEVEG